MTKEVLEQLSRIKAARFSTGRKLAEDFIVTLVMHRMLPPSIDGLATAGEVSSLESEYLTARQAAKRVNVHPNTLKRWVKTGKLPAARIGNRGDVRVKTADLESLMSKDREINVPAFLKNKKNNP